MTTKEFGEAAKKFKAKINGFNSMVKIKYRNKSKEDIGDVALFDVELHHLKVDPFLNSAVLNVSREFTATCEAAAKKLFKKEITWNNICCIFWICND